MLEQWAIAYISHDETELRGIAILVLLAGFIAALLLTRTRGELRRAPYFALSALAILAYSAIQFIWIASLDAMMLGVLWIIVVIDLLVTFAFGYFYGMIARARSLDAFGSGGYAFLAIIPFANLVLMLKPSENELSANRVPTVGVITGGWGVVLGFVMYAVAYGLTPVVENQVERMAEKAGEDPAMQAASTDMLIKGWGLEKALTMMAEEVAVPMKIDEVTTLIRLVADGKTLRCNYAVSSNSDFMTPAFSAALTQQMCTNEAMGHVLKAHGTLEHAYFRTDGSKIGAVVITHDDCNN